MEAEIQYADLVLAAVGLLVMMYPILCKVRFETLHRVFSTREIWIQIGFSIVLNWIVAPLLMVCLLPVLQCKEDLLTVYSWVWHGHSCQTRKGFEMASSSSG